MIDDSLQHERLRTVIAEIALVVNKRADDLGLVTGADVARRLGMDNRRVRRLLNAEFVTLNTLVPVLDGLGLELVVQRKTR